MKDLLKDLKWNAIIGALIMIATGIILIIFPSVSLSVLATIVGVGAICAGLFSIIRFFTYDLKESFYRNDFLIGIVVLTIGILILFKPAIFISIIPFVLGIVIMFSSFSKLQDGITAKRLGYPNHMLYIILALVDCVFGLIVLFNPFEAATILFIIIGLGLVYSGVSDLYVTVYLSKRFNEFYKALNDTKDTQL